jgi:hypothetical protein
MVFAGAEKSNTRSSTGIFVHVIAATFSVLQVHLKPLIP